jgi:MFS family permease
MWALIAVGSALLGVGFVLMATAPSLPVALVGAVIAGAGNGIEAVSARTALQELVEPAWMAMMISLNESMFQIMPGAGILLGGAITALTNPRLALWVAGCGSLAIAAVAWLVLRPRMMLEALPAPAVRSGNRSARSGAPSPRRA